MTQPADVAVGFNPDDLIIHVKITRRGRTANAQTRLSADSLARESSFGLPYVHDLVDDAVRRAGADARGLMIGEGLL